MNRVIKDYSSVQKHHLDLIAEHFPSGFEVEDLIRITLNGKEIKCLQLVTDDVVYLFKMDIKMIDILDENFEADFDISDVEDLFNDEY